MVALRKDRAQLHFDEDGKKYWFKLSEARQWRVEPLRDSEAEAEAEVEVEAGVEAEGRVRRRRRRQRRRRQRRRWSKRRGCSSSWRRLSSR